VRASAEVSLGDRSRSNGSRQPSVRIKGYNTDKYVDTRSVAALSISTNDYLVIKHSNVEGSNGKVVMSYPHLARFVDGLDAVLDKLRDGCFRRVDERGFEILPAAYDVYHQIDDLYGPSALGFRPVLLLEKDDDEIGTPGVRMFVNSNSHCSDVDLDSFTAFVRFYDRFDLSAASGMMLATAAGMGLLTGEQQQHSRSSAPQPMRKS
jgi:hypothetical protein